MKYDVVVIGGGIVGCATAYYLARDGASVALLERGRTASEATGASAGMLAPVAEAKRLGPFLHLVVAALRDYPAAVADIEAASGVSTGYNQRSILRVAFSVEDEAKFDNALPMYDEARLPYKRLDGAAARAEEPALGPGCISAILSPEEGQVAPRQITQAFRFGATLHGAKVFENTEAVGLETRYRTVTGVRTMEGVVSANAVVVAAGAWSSRFEALLNTRVSVHPVRGQLVVLKNLPTPVRHVLYSYGGYAVPTADGRLLVGATQEEVGYVSRSTVAGVRQVLEGGQRLVPSIMDAEIDEVWAGLRPGSSDAMPILGPADGWENVWLATGHYRNGILLGPYTARLLAASMRAGKLADALEAFHPGRLNRDGVPD